VPTDLISDPTTTPFNIGDRIVLSDFTESEAVVLSTGLGAGGNEVLQRILYWTHGHPFLTQSLAATAASRSDIHSATGVDRLTTELLFQAKARETNINLADVGNRILNGYSDPDQIAKFRADVLSLYERILKGEDVYDDESNHLMKVLKLSGIVRVEDRKLRLRNRIYERVFDRRWIRENMPGAELRRQRRAYIKGVVRTAAVAAVVIAIIGALAIQVRRERDRANYEVYVADMNLMRPMWEQSNLERMDDLLEATKDNPARGWEWDYWYHMAHLEVSTYPKRLVSSYTGFYAPNGKVYVREDGKIREFSPETGEIVDILPIAGEATGGIYPVADGRHLFEYDGVQGFRLIDVPQRRVIAQVDNFGFFNVSPAISPDGRWVVGALVTDFQPPIQAFKSAALWNTATAEITSLPTSPMRSVAASPNGKLIAAAELDGSRSTINFHAVVREFGSWNTLAVFETLGETERVIFSPDGARLATSTRTGWIQLWDLNSKREIARTRATEGVTYHLEFSNDGSWLAASSVDRVGRLYDLSESKITLMKSFRDAGLLSISPDKSRVAATYDNLRFYDPQNYIETPTVLSGRDEESVEVSVLAKKAPAYVRARDKVYEVDPLTGRSVELTWFMGKPFALPLSGQSWGVVLREDQTTEIVDFDTHRTVLALPKESVPAGAVTQFPDNRRVAVFFLGGSVVEMWDAVDKRMLKRIQTPAPIVWGAASPDGRWFATSQLGDNVSVWDAATWTERRMARSGVRVWTVAFSPDSSRIVGSIQNNTVGVWDVRSGDLIGKLTGHSQGVADLAYSPDGRRIVTASGDGTVRIWDAVTFRELSSLSGHNQPVVRARFSDDGRSIISIDIQGNAKAWLTKTPSQ
jgi:WD40 repeat protein